MSSNSPNPVANQDTTNQDLVWHKVAEADDLPEGRVITVNAGLQSLALCHFDGCFSALDNHCPHQGGPLGEGSIENGWLRCPWHGYDYHPLTGKPPPPFTDATEAFPTEVRPDGIYVALPRQKTRVRTVSDLLVETMQNWGVRAVFGMVGHSNLGFADALHHAESNGTLKFYGIRHEGAAAFAASAYGKLTGQLSACFAIAGPGSTNLLTGLYDAKIDRSPVLAISGQVPSSVAGRGAFQDLDLAHAFADVSAYSQTVNNGSNYAELATLACKTALVERSVGHLILPDEVQNIPVAPPTNSDTNSDTHDGAHATTHLLPDLPAGSPDGRLANQQIAPPAESLEAACELLGQARRPVLIVGAGARFDMGNILALAEKLGAPVATTFKAKGLISDFHELGCGVLGRSGTPIASWFMNESDLLLVFGASFSDHTGIASYKPIIQVDYDPMALGRFHSVAVPVLGHVGVTAIAMLEMLGDASPGDQRPDQRPEVAERWKIWREEKAARRGDDTGHGVNSAAVFDSLGKLVDEDAVLCVDVGNNTYSFGRYFEVGRQSVLMSGYLGSIGFGFPAAMGAYAAENPAGGARATGTVATGTGRQVVSISGDGGFGQYAMELTTAVKYDMNITHILLNNNELGKISKEQRAGQFEVWQTSLKNPDFAKFSELCGARGHKVTETSALDSTIGEALAHPGVSLVEIMTDAALV